MSDVIIALMQLKRKAEEKKLNKHNNTVQTSPCQFFNYISNKISEKKRNVSTISDNIISSSC